MQWRNWVSPENRWFSLEVSERKTFSLHMIYAILDGLALGFIALNEFVLLRNLSATAMQVSMLFQVATLFLPFSIFLTSFLSKIRNKKRVLLWVGFITRAPLLAIAFFPASIESNVYAFIFLAIFLLYYLANPIILPMLNLFTKSNYSSNRFGRMFSYSMMITQVATLAGTYFFGYSLDIDPLSYRWIYPVLGVCGFLAIYLITLMPYALDNTPPDISFTLKRGRQILSDAWTILRNNRPFAAFQKGMMAYGFGILMAQAVVTIYLSEFFALSYSDLALYKNIPIIVSILSFPVFGSFMDKYDPRKIATLCFFFHGLYYVFLILAAIYPHSIYVSSHQLVYLLVIGHIIQGLFVASIGLVWGIGSSYFAPVSQAATYHSIHLSLTGIRGIIAPPIGVLIYYLGGFYAAFSASILTQILAMYIMHRSERKEKRR